jgi:hypothetical protein
VHLVSPPSSGYPVALLAMIRYGLDGRYGLRPTLKPRGPVRVGSVAATCMSCLAQVPEAEPASDAPLREEIEIDPGEAVVVAPW